jgi:DNA-3-methyladenine glycosylase II
MNYNTALDHLRQDPTLKSVIDTTVVEWPASDGDVYAHLIRSVIYQQLSGKAAGTIHGRFLDLFADGYPHPDTIRSFDILDLRAVGLSRQKASYIQNVAEFFLENKLIGKDWTDYPDKEILQTLTQIKGIGKWTVQMILMFTLQRPDIFPTDDLGIQQAMVRLFDLDQKGRALKKTMVELAESWRPYRTTASLYLWRWKDTK